MYHNMEYREDLLLSIIIQPIWTDWIEECFYLFVFFSFFFFVYFRDHFAHFAFLQTVIMCFQARSYASQLPFRRRKNPTADQGFYYRKIVPMPTRPPWRKGASKAEVEGNEERVFREYITKLYNRYGRKKLNFFEHNLQVWRQLWRTCERSDLLLVLADARHPLFNFPPSLYDYVVKDLKKPMVLILNKVSLFYFFFVCVHCN